jgi:hypothetical protein
VIIKYGYHGVPREPEDIEEAVGAGWSDIIKRLISDLEGLGWDGNLLQIKEKFGGLRFYIGKGTEKIHARILQAEEESFKVCELCGEKGKPRGGGWIKTLCGGCAKPRPSLTES